MGKRQRHLTDNEIAARVRANASARGMTTADWVKGACEAVDWTGAATAKPPAPSPRRVKLTREERDAQRKRESELFAELAQAHGYTIADMPKLGDRTTIVMAGSKVATNRVMRLMVPSDSELARTLDRLVDAHAKAVAKGVVVGKQPKPRSSPKPPRAARAAKRGGGSGAKPRGANS